jgi:hypothetical protein
MNGSLFVFKLCVYVYVCVCGQSDTQFRYVSKGDCYYRAKKRFREDLILPELLSANLSDVHEDIFQ